ncbi:MAG: hypothetical protein INR62_04190 [Rhodospirillales bacterium]|nr:hypothetical protein [Acetobacter sp.]
MTTYLFGTAITVQSYTRPARAKTVRQPNTKPTPEMPASLWRHTQNEDAAETSHHRTAGRMLAGAAILSLGSVAYAICQTGALLSGSRLHDAVAEFLR